MFKLIGTTFSLILTFACLAEATVCEDYPNPCLQQKECSTKSDFVFEATVTSISDLEVAAPDYGKGVNQLIKQKTALLKIEKWIKGAPQTELTQIFLPLDKWYCSEIKPIFSELQINKKYRVFGVYDRSENYCLAYHGQRTAKNADELDACHSDTKMEEQSYWLLELLE